MEKGTPQIDGKWRDFWLRRRQALLIELGAIEDILNLPRSVTPKHARTTVPPSNRASG